MLVTLYKEDEVHFRLLGTNGFNIKAKKNERLTAASSRCRQSLKMKTLRRYLADHVKNCTKKRAARAARLSFVIQPIKSLIRGVDVAVVVVIS